MEAFAVVLTIGLAFTAVALPLLPLVRGAGMPRESEREGWSDLATLREQRDATLQAIQDLDEETARGNLTPEEHRALRSRHVRRAAALIREIEGRERVLEEEIDRAVQRYRQRRQASAARRPDSVGEEGPRGRVGPSAGR